MTMAYSSHSDIDTHLAVRAFQILREKGQPRDGEYHYGGLSGSTDFDGYTVFLHDENVDLTVFFKHRFTLDCSKPEDLEVFKRKVQSVADDSKS